MRIAIIGAGAAGCFAAANIPGAGHEVVVFEKTGKPMQKVRVSGGGRCNVTHHLFDIPELIDRYPRGKQLLRRTLHQFGPQDTIDWFKDRGVSLKAENDGRMFPVTDSSETIIDCIWQQMMKNKVQVRYHKTVVAFERKGAFITIHFNDGETYEADKALISSGGFPKPEQYKWIETTGHSIQSPVPSLFTFNIPKHPIIELMGVSVPEVTVKVNGTKIMEQGPVLVTHWGLSGPVVLRASAWGARELHERNYEFQVQVNWLLDRKEQDVKDEIADLRRSQGGQLVATRNPFGLPRRLWEYFLSQCSIGETVRWGELPAAAQNKLIEKLVRETFHVKGKTTFKEEFVTSGGIKLSEVDPLTMESRIMPGLYFAGEILDVDGITGGFNFQHAWASGKIAANQMMS
jgi:predicted Rossmann fold flavoprotein